MTFAISSSDELLLDIAAAVRGATIRRLQHRCVEVTVLELNCVPYSHLQKLHVCLWHVSTVFTRSAITPPEVKRFG